MNNPKPAFQTKQGLVTDLTLFAREYELPHPDGKEPIRILCGWLPRGREPIRILCKWILRGEEPIRILCGCLPGLVGGGCAADLAQRIFKSLTLSVVGR